MRINYHITLDVSKQGVQVTVPLTQHDIGVHRLILTLRNGEEVVSLTAADHAALYLPDSDVWDPVAVYTAESAYPNTLVYDLSPAVSSKAGMHRGVITLADGAGKVLFTPELAFCVRGDITVGTTVTESPAYAAVILAQSDAEAAAIEAELSAMGAADSARAASASAKEAAETAASLEKSVSDQIDRTVSDELDGRMEQAMATLHEKIETYVDEEELEASVTAAINGRYQELYDVADEARSYVDRALATATSVLVVPSLPEVGAEHKLYLVPKGGENSDLYEEYLWVNRGSAEAPDMGWELVASKSLDLTDYVKRTDIATSTEPGLVCVSQGQGIGIYGTSKALYLKYASEAEIRAATYKYYPITTSNAEFAVTHHGQKHFASKADGESLKQRLRNLEAAAEEKLYVPEALTVEEGSVLESYRSYLPVAALCEITLGHGESVGSKMGDVRFGETFLSEVETLCSRLSEASSEQCFLDLDLMGKTYTLGLPDEELIWDEVTLPESVVFEAQVDGSYVFETELDLPEGWIDCAIGTCPELQEYGVEHEITVHEAGRGILRVVILDDDDEETSEADRAESLADALSGLTVDIEGHGLTTETGTLDVDFSPYPTLYTDETQGESLSLGDLTDGTGRMTLTVMRKLADET